MLTFDPDKAFAELEAAAQDWSEAEYAASRLEELKKVMLAKIQVSKGDISVAKAEILALADPSYEQHIEGMVAARERANRLKARYLDMRLLAEMRRTAEATLRSLKV